MSTVKAYTARVPHKCDTCHWTPSLRGVATILPGHRYLVHVAFPGDEGYEEGTSPARLRECATHAIERDDFTATSFGICGTYCCGTKPCVLPFDKAGAGYGHDHTCDQCAHDRAAEATQ